MLPTEVLERQEERTDKERHLQGEGKLTSVTIFSCFLQKKKKNEVISELEDFWPVTGILMTVSVKFIVEAQSL